MRARRIQSALRGSGAREVLLAGKHGLDGLTHPRQRIAFRNEAVCAQAHASRCTPAFLPVAIYQNLCVRMLPPKFPKKLELPLIWRSDTNNNHPPRAFARRSQSFVLVLGLAENQVANLF